MLLREDLTGLGLLLLPIDLRDDVLGGLSVGLLLGGDLGGGLTLTSPGDRTFGGLLLMLLEGLLLLTLLTGLLLILRLLCTACGELIRALGVLLILLRGVTLRLLLILLGLMLLLIALLGLGLRLLDLSGWSSTTSGRLSSLLLDLVSLSYPLLCCPPFFLRDRTPSLSNLSEPSLLL